MRLEDMRISNRNVVRCQAAAETIGKFFPRENVIRIVINVQVSLFDILCHRRRRRESHLTTTIMMIVIISSISLFISFLLTSAHPSRRSQIASVRDEFSDSNRFRSIYFHISAEKSREMHIVAVNKKEFPTFQPSATSAINSPPYNLEKATTTVDTLRGRVGRRWNESRFGQTMARNFIFFARWYFRSYTYIPQAEAENEIFRVLQSTRLQCLWSPNKLRARHSMVFVRIYYKFCACTRSSSTWINKFLYSPQNWIMRGAAMK